MTVWTNITLEEADNWLVERRLGRVIAVHPIEEGSEDSVFRLDLENGGRFFLRIFERTEAEGPSRLAEIFSSHGLPACSPISDSKGGLLSELKGKPAAVYPWIDGDWNPRPSLEQIGAVGNFLGMAGRIGLEHCGHWKRENPRGWQWLKETTEKLCAAISKEASEELAEETSLHLSFWNSPETADLPRAPIHADLFRENALWDAEGKLVAVIDWGFCASGYPLLFDLAIVANDWCLKNGSFELDAQKLQTLLDEREKALPLSQKEKKVWPMALRWAALRFYLSRLHDKVFPRGGKELDPNHFLGILRARKNLS